MEDSQARFKSLFEKNPSSRAIRVLRDPIISDGKPALFKGTVSKMESDFGFITRDGFADEVFMHISDVEEESWSLLSWNLRVQFSIGFYWRGTKAYNVMPEVLK